MFDIFSQRVQFKFKNRVSAAITLSEMLKGTIKKKEREQTLVLGICRGGILTADIVTKRMLLPNFDIVIPRKLTDPHNKEQAVGAIIRKDCIFVFNDLIRDLHITEEYLKTEIDFEMNRICEMEEKYFQYTQNDTLMKHLDQFSTLLLIDDGIASGATMSVIIKWIHSIWTNIRTEKRRLIVAAPVGPKNVLDLLVNKYGIEVVTVFQPSSTSFYSVEQYHLKFEEVQDEQIIEILRERVTNKLNKIGKIT